MSHIEQAQLLTPIVDYVPAMGYQIYLKVKVTSLYRRTSLFIQLTSNIIIRIRTICKTFLLDTLLFYLLMQCFECVNLHLLLKN